jgi:HPt (histidine-containing phosphotransfer) domain-containing protein
MPDPLSPTPVSSEPILNPQALARLRELDPTGANRLLPRLVEAFLKSLDRMLPDLAAACAGTPPDLGTVRHVTHTLKSSAASLGAEQLSKHCAQIESMARNAQLHGLEARVGAMLEEVAKVRHALEELIRQ